MVTAFCLLLHVFQVSGDFCFLLHVFHQAKAFFVSFFVHSPSAASLYGCPIFESYDPSFFVSAQIRRALTREFTTYFCYFLVLSSTART